MSKAESFADLHTSRLIITHRVQVCLIAFCLVWMLKSQRGKHILSLGRRKREGGRKMMFWAHCWSHSSTKAPLLLTPHLPPELLPRYPYHMSWWRQGSYLIFRFLGIYQFLPYFNPLVGTWEFRPLVELFITASPWVRPILQQTYWYKPFLSHAEG